MTDTNPYQIDRLVLPEFKQLYQQTERLPFWLRYLLLGLLVYVQDRYLTAKIEQTVTDAINTYTDQHLPSTDNSWVDKAKVTIIENPDSLHQLPTLSITAPYITSHNTNEPPE